MPLTKSQKKAQKVLRENEAIKRTAQAEARRLGRGGKGKGTRAVDPNACVSDCTKNYLRAVTNPFQPHRACLPIPPCMPSQNLSTFARGTMTADANGNCWAMFSPENFINYDSYVNLANTQGLWFTDGTAVATTMNVAAASGVTRVEGNSPFSVTEVVNFGTFGIQFRLYAAGLRVRYTGTELNRGGNGVGLCEPDNGGWSVSTTYGHLAAYDGASLISVDRRWRELVWIPRSPDDYQYDGLVPSRVAGPLAFYFQTEPGNTFEVEAWAHFEIVGSLARSKVGRTADPIGGYAVMDVIANYAGSAANFVHKYYDVLKQVGHTVAHFSGMGNQTIPTNIPGVTWHDEL